MTKFLHCEKTIYILGAGALISHSNENLPDINRFFLKAKELLPKYYDIPKDDLNIIQDYIYKKFGINIFNKVTRTNKPDIEYILTQIEIELERKTSGKLIILKENILNLIKYVLIRSDIDRTGDYNDFIKILNPNDSIITFNWDLCLDNIMGRESIINGKSYNEFKDNPYYNFHYDFTETSNFFPENMGADKPYIEWPSNHSYYLKMHGSIDWRYCTNNSCKNKNEVYPIVEALEDYNCPCCHEKMNILLIPPVLNKQYLQYPLIRQLWNTAVNEIMKVNNLVIWGYSLPATDFYSKWLLNYARFSPGFNKIIIINPEIINKNKNNYTVRYTFIRKFYDLFRDLIPKNQLFLYSNFDNFRNDIDISKEINKAKMNGTVKGL